MAKSKWPLVEENLDNIKKWASEGLSDKQIADLIPVGRSTFERYKKEHEELTKALKDGKKPLIEKLENTMTKRALGYDYEEEKVYVKVDEDGKKTEYREVTKKHQPPSVQALVILLFNKDKDDNGKPKWSSDPAKRDLDERLLELRKSIEDLKSWG